MLHLWMSGDSCGTATLVPQADAVALGTVVFLTPEQDLRAPQQAPQGRRTPQKAGPCRGTSGEELLMDRGDANPVQGPAGGQAL